MLRLVLRPLLSFIVLAALVFALLQGVGRVAFGLLAHLEVAANQLLAGRQIRLDGLEGDWRGFNPIVRIARLELPAGHIEDLYVELDLLQTLLTSRYVLYRARVADAALLLEKTGAAGWRLAGMPAGGDFDPLPLLTSTDQMQFTGALGFSRDEQPTTVLEMEYTGSNRAGVARHRLAVRNDEQDCAEPCELRLELQVRESGWGIARPETTLTLSATQILIGESLLGFADVQLDALEVDWQDSGERSGGRALLLASGTLAGGGEAFEARLGGVTRGRDDRHWGQVTRLEVSQGAQHLQFPVIDLDLREGVLHASLPSLPVAELTGLLRTVLARNDVASRWLGALALEARIDDLRAFYRFATGDLGYGFELADFATDGYRGVPRVRGGAGSVIGHTRLATGRPQFDVGHAVQLDLDAVDMRFAFPDLVRDEWSLPFARGQLQAWFRRDEFALRGLRLLTRTGESELSGSVGISRIGKDERDRRIGVLARIDRITVEAARRFVPFTLRPRLYEWLTTTPMDGVMRDARVAYQGQFKVPEGEPGRRLEIAAEIEDARLRFHPEWPELQAFAGYLEVAGREVRATARAAQSLGADLAGTRLWLQDNGARANVSLNAGLDASVALALVRQSPLQGWMPVVAPDWAGSGPLRVAGDLSIPMRRAADAVDPAVGASPADTPPQQGLAVDLAFELDGVGLDLPGYRLQFGDLVGPLRYRYPATLLSEGIDGTLFEAPVRITADSTRDRFRLRLAGTARSGDLWRVVDVKDPSLTEGETAFEARLDLAAPAGPEGRQTAAGPPRLTVRSDLEGLAMRLPGEYAKAADETAPLEVELVFPGDDRLLTFTYREARGWLRFSKRLEQGAIGLGVEPGALPRDRRELLLTGGIDRIESGDLPPGEASTGALPLPVRVRDFEVGVLAVGAFEVADARLDADLQPDGFDVRMTSENLAGSARRRVDREAPAGASPRPIEVVVEKLRLPPASGKGDPLPVDLIGRIFPMDVVLEQMSVGDDDYGRWKFALRPEGGDLWFRDLEGRLRGVDVIAADGLVWRGATDTTTFEGELRMTDLAEVLPLWGYAPSVETERASLAGTMTWPGSPASFKLLALEGEARVNARTGRFLEVESGGGAQRILSLLNFTAIAKRMSFDFSDVFGRGVSFDKLKATISLNQGMLEFVKPLDVEGTGLRFKLTGTVSLSDRVLDHEMIVTLPVSRGLPWYAAYIALANPIAGLGVLVGERMLRKPLEQVSSAKYRITGTVEDPQVRLVSVFDSSTSEQPVELPVEVPVDPPVQLPVELPVELPVDEGTVPAAGDGAATP